MVSFSWCGNALSPITEKEEEEVAEKEKEEEVGF